MESLLDIALAELLKSRNIDLSGYRRSTLGRRLAHRLRRLGGPDHASYIQKLRTDPEESDRLIDALTVNVTSFFRDPAVFEFLKQEVLPSIIDQKNNNGSKEIRVWCAGCSTGEEAFSVAILIDQILMDEPSAWTPLIFATDISREVLKKAQEGIYTRDQLKDAKLGIIDKYFTSANENFAIRPGIRGMVNFSFDDIVQPNRFAPMESIFGGFDLVLCRNVMIYFLLNQQRAILDKLNRSLNARGFLVLGKSESIDKELEARFETVNKQYRIFQKTPY